MDIRMGFALLLIGLLSFQAADRAAAGAAEDTVTVSAEAVFTPRHPVPEAAALALALLDARYKAVAMGAERLSRKGLLTGYGDRQEEILCLAADRIDADTIEERFAAENGGCTVKIRARVGPVDFIRAQILDQALEKAEKHLSFREEMEQPVSPGLNPGMELSRAYRYLRKEQWRIAVIYLDHLQGKYPEWAAIYLAKAKGLRRLNQTVMMTDALQTACLLGSPEACQKLRNRPTTSPPD